MLYYSDINTTDTLRYTDYLIIRLLNKMKASHHKMIYDVMHDISYKCHTEACIKKHDNTCKASSAYVAGYAPL